MLGRGATLAVLVFAAVAQAAPGPKPVDIKPFKDTLVVLADAEGGIYVVTREGDRRVFYGQQGTKVVYEQINEGGSRNRDAFTYNVHAPRAKYPFIAAVGRREDGTYFRACADDYNAELTELTGAKAAEVLDKWKFLSTAMTYKPYLLARDDSGVYYYVDRLRDRDGGTGYRVFVGKKGALKPMALTDVVSDSAGDVFSTKTGDLRLVHTTSQATTPKVAGEAYWIRGARKTQLVYVDIYMNQPLIYRDFGLYKIPGMICGNI